MRMRMRHFWDWPIRLRPTSAFVPLRRDKSAGQGRNSAFQFRLMAIDRFSFFIASLVSHCEGEEKLTVSLTFRQLTSSDLQWKKF
jgi:hypothetical protein